MRTKLINILLGLFILFFFVGFISVKETFAADYQLSGSVKDGGGNAITNATVDVYTPGTTTDVVSPTTTDSSGDYTFSSLPSGTYDIKVTPASGSNFTSAIALSQNISTDTTLNFILVPSGSIKISGTIYDATGSPLSGASVYLQLPNGSTVSSQATDSSGNYSFQTSSGTYYLLITNGSNTLGNYPYHYQLPLPNTSYTESTIQDITIPAKSVSIHTQDENGNAIGNVALSTGANLVGENNLDVGGGVTVSGSDGYINNTLRTDGNGNATMWLFPGNNSYTIIATPPGGLGVAQTTFPNNTVSDVTNLTLTLQPSITITGILSDPLGTPVSGSAVYLELSDGSVVSTSYTDNSGNYSFQVAPGTYQFLITNGSETGNYPYHYQLSFPDTTYTQNTTQNITIPASKVTIHIQDGSGTSISNVALSTGTNLIGENNLNVGGGVTVSGADGYTINNIRTDSSGNATMWLFPGSSPYTFIATPPGGQGLTQTTFDNNTISGDTNLTLTMQRSITISGIVYDAAGVPLQGASVNLQLPNGSEVTSSTTDASGNYSFQTSSGTYQLLILNGNSGLGNYPYHYQISLPDTTYDQDTAQNITIPADKVTIHVQDPNGVAVSNVALSTGTNLIGEDNLNIGEGVTVSGADGYVDNSLKTDASGSATMWLFPGSNSYTIIATPLSGSIYSQFTLNNVSVTGDQTEVVSLQYNHAPPVTTASFSPSPFSDGTYSDPTTVTLSATAASGYTVANTYYTIDGGSRQTYTAPFTVTGAGSHTITYWSVDNSGVTEATNTKTFTITEAYGLTGTVYNDANQNGFQDSGEQGYEGATVTLNTGQSTTTDSNGSYTFSNLEAGTYTETLTVPDGYTATTTNPATVALAADTTENFGIAQQQATPIVAINAGGDTEGNYAADTDYSGGTTYATTDSVDTSNVTNPAPQAVYQTVRYGNFSYTIPNLTANGTYTVRLHFNELYWNAAGQRTFNTSINGTQVLSNFDIYQTAGGKDKAIVEQFPVTADANGNVTIQFTSVTDNAMVNGIELYNGTLPSPTPTPSPTPVQSASINAGGATAGDYQADNGYTGGTTYSTTASIDTSNVTNPAPEAVYQTVRYGNFSYTIPTNSPDTNYTVRLDFSEPYFNSAGSRLFNVTINGTQDLSNFDVYQAAGGENKAVAEQFTTTTDSDGLIHIQFDSVVDNAMVSGIAVSQQ